MTDNEILMEALDAYAKAKRRLAASRKFAGPFLLSARVSLRNDAKQAAQILENFKSGAWAV